MGADPGNGSAEGRQLLFRLVGMRTNEDLLGSPRLEEIDDPPGAGQPALERDRIVESIKIEPLIQRRQGSRGHLRSRSIRQGPEAQPATTASARQPRTSVARMNLRPDTAAPRSRLASMMARGERASLLRNACFRFQSILPHIRRSRWRFSSLTSCVWGNLTPARGGVRPLDRVGSRGLLRISGPILVRSSRGEGLLCVGSPC